MKMLTAAVALTLLGSGSAMAFDSQTQATIDHYKLGKRLPISLVGHLMGASERWCYSEQDGSCAWSDIYLAVTNEGAEFEITNAWSQEVDIAFTDEAQFRDDRYICETGFDWVPSVRATRRSDDSLIGGRELAELKDTIASYTAGNPHDCFDYLYLSSDPAQQTVTLLQRQYVADQHVSSADVEVTLHFDADNAAALTSRL